MGPGQAYVERTLASGKQVEDALARAVKAQKAWKQVPVAERAAVCRRSSGQQVLDWIAPQLIEQDALIQVLPGPLNGARRLPGDLYVLGNDLLAASPGPEAPAGHLIAASLAVEDKAATLDALRHAGLFNARYPRPVSGCAAEVSSRIAESSSSGMGIAWRSVTETRCGEE